MLQTLGALALTLAMAGNAQAQPLTLEDLFDGATITAGDKLFDEWTFFDYFTTDFDRIFDASNIEVTPLHDGGNDPGPGLLFSVLNNELEVTGDGFYSFVDLMFGFRVTSLTKYLIKDNSLALIDDPDEMITEGFEDTGIYIRETVGTQPWLADLGLKEVERSYKLGGPSTSDLTDLAVFEPQQSVYVTKNILVWATDVDETARLTAFEQRFSQVPEPATLGLLALGLAGLGFMRRRRT